MNDKIQVWLRITVNKFFKLPYIYKQSLWNMLLISKYLPILQLNKFHIVYFDNLQSLAYRIKKQSNSVLRQINNNIYI